MSRMSFDRISKRARKKLDDLVPEVEKIIRNAVHDMLLSWVKRYKKSVRVRGMYPSLYLEWRGDEGWYSWENCGGEAEDELADIYRWCCDIAISYRVGYLKEIFVEVSK